jgi:hypothetical protein
MSVSFRYFVATFAAVLALLSGVASAQFEGMLSRVPADANTLIMIDAEKLFGSRLADRERWEARRKAAFDAGVSALPPDASSIVMAAHTDFETSHNSWELALTRFNNGRDVSSVPKRFGGSMDMVSGKTAAKLPSDHYVVQISPNILGAYTPASRQSVSRWITSTERSNLSAETSPYLMTAFGYATKVGTPIVMAIDVSGVISADQAAIRLAEFTSIGKDDAMIAAVAKLAASVEGATLGITVGDSVFGAIRVDFNDVPGLSAEALKPILLEVISRQGAMVDDFESWQPSIEGKTWLLKGPLSTAGTRRVLSVLELPPVLAHSLDESSGASPTGSGGANASKLYFQSVKNLLDDLRAKPKKDRVQTMGQAALWYDKYARKIDQLPILGVDPVLLNYGSDIAGGLRDANSALRGVGMRTSVRTINNGANIGGPVATFGGGNTGGFGHGFGGFNYSYFNLRSGDRVVDSANAAIRMEERVSGAATVQTIWKNIDEATAMIRREMTQKYEIEF